MTNASEEISEASQIIYSQEFNSKFFLLAERANLVSAPATAEV